MNNWSFRTVTGSAVVLLALGAGILPGLVAQEAGKAAAKGKSEEKKTSKKPEGRLPSNYGKIGLTDEQRAQVYAIHDRFEVEINDLEKKLADVKAKQTAEYEAVLNGNQKESLKTLNEETKSKASSKKKGSDKPGEKPSDAEEKAAK